MHEEKLHTVAEVAARLQVHPLTVRRFIAEGRLKAIKLGPGKRSSVRIAESALQEFLSSH